MAEQIKIILPEAVKKIIRLSGVRIPRVSVRRLETSSLFFIPEILYNVG